MNCIIIDEYSNSSLLRDLVARCTSLNLVGVYNEFVSAMNLMSKKHRIDLAFVDIEASGMDSINLLNNLSSPPAIIAVSSDGKNAMKAFDQNCVDYLIKPVSYSRFYKAVDKIKRFNVTPETSDSKDQEIFIKDNTSLTRLNANDITYIEAIRNNIIVNTIEKKYTLYFTLKGFESKLPQGIFTRIHRSFIVNKGLIRMVNGNHLEIEQGDEIKTLPVGKLFRKQILNEMHVINNS